MNQSELNLYIWFFWVFETCFCLTRFLKLQAYKIFDTVISSVSVLKSPNKVIITLAHKLCRALLTNCKLVEILFLLELFEQQSHIFLLRLISMKKPLRCSIIFFLLRLISMKKPLRCSIMPLRRITFYANLGFWKCVINIGF